MSERTSFWKRVGYAALTAAIIQNVWIGGGYGSGREIVQYIARFGSLGWISIVVGSLALLIALLLSFEIARRFKAFDYRIWSRQFLWKFWPAFEVSYIILAWIVIAVVGAAAGFMLSDLANIPYWVSVTIVLLAIFLLHFYGRKVIEGFWIVGTVGLYMLYIAIWVVFLSVRGGVAMQNISAGVHQGTITEAAISGFQYTMYNLVVVASALQSADRYKGKMESIFASILSVFFVYITAALLWICFMGWYPEVIGMTVPVYEIAKSLGVSWLLYLYVFWIFYTLIATALGMIYAIVRRVSAQLEARGKKLRKSSEAIIASLLFLVSVITAQVGLVTLVAKGYGTLAWVFFAVYFIPIVTIGAVRILKPEWRKDLWG
ncbi:MAG: hypothetical protein QW326_02640 [Fervidicoccaceae archaeon]